MAERENHEDYLDRPELLEDLPPEELRRLVGRLAIARRDDQARIAQLRGSVDRLSTDELIDTIMTPQGVNERIILNPELQEELHRGMFAVFGIDIRGVKSLNDRSFAHGNELIALLVERGLLSTVRHDDLVSRRGDDFFVLARNVTPEEAATIADRLNTTYSVEQGVEDIQNGLIPVMASVSYMHATELPGTHTSLTDLLNWKKALEIKVTARNVPPKKAQYAAMWAMLEGDPNHQPGDERYIAKLFFQRFCADFEDQIEESMSRRLVADQ